MDAGKGIAEPAAGVDVKGRLLSGSRGQLPKHADSLVLLTGVIRPRQAADLRLERLTALDVKD
jgi:hypothetical protein